MLKRKRIKEKGKVSFTRYFQKFEPNERVSLVRDLGFTENFPMRMQGRTGVIIEKRGSSYLVEALDGGMKKRFFVKPIHLKKLTIK